MERLIVASLFRRIVEEEFGAAHIGEVGLLAARVGATAEKGLGHRQLAHKARIRLLRSRGEELVGVEHITCERGQKLVCLACAQLSVEAS
jgi:hypothetical protein